MKKWGGKEKNEKFGGVGDENWQNLLVFGKNLGFDPKFLSRPASLQPPASSIPPPGGVPAEEKILQPFFQPAPFFQLRGWTPPLSP